MKAVLTPTELRRAIEREARQMQRHQKLMGIQVGLLYRNFSKELKSFLRDPKNYDNRSALNLAASIKIIDRLGDLLDDAGLSDLKRQQRLAYGALADSALDYFDLLGLDLKYSDIGQEVLDAYVRFNEGQLDRLLDQRLVAPAQQVLFQSALGNQPTPDAIAAVLGMVDGLSPAAVENGINFALEAFQRQVTVETGDALGLDVYFYDGPNDAITSDQCREMLEIDIHGAPGFLYKDEITTELHEDLVYPPLQAGGHPNCRHKWIPVTLEYAISEGFEP